MFLKVVTLGAILYGLWIAAVLAYDRRKRGRKIVGESRKTTATPDEIMGKSLFVLSQSLPQAASKSETENPEQKADTFAAEPEKRTSAQIPEEMLDEVFSDSPEDIPEEDWVDDAQDDSQINLEAEEEGLNGEPIPDDLYATGVFYEDMNDAAQILAKISPSGQERYRAGRTMSLMDGNDLSVKMAAHSAEWSSRIGRLIDEFAEHQMAMAIPEQSEHKPLHIPDNPAEFDIRNFM
ncbi:hypothetical protein HCH04_15020 [Bacteroides thetaiotaomicron]|uniref:hypothetical protein n=1 Tax=Bacteroides thetaiotaomicron TaxID=818 RepID=UPI001C8BACDF|nr:hypothetical protein [Bacteroides thetaiotaomicron]MBX9049623.1 hypothetical protein [Bacteroides thetaiotaomicron]MBX9072951.1 hypothetical protein [Bacteroides thetaiotaomicron]